MQLFIEAEVPISSVLNFQELQANLNHVHALYPKHNRFGHSNIG